MKLKPVHPGEILKKDFMEPINLPLLVLSKECRIQKEKLFNVIEGKEPITFNIAHKLSTVFGNSTDFWLNAQKTYDSQNGAN